MSNKLPQGWVKTTLNEIAIWGSGGTPSRTKLSYFGGPIPWIKTGELGAKYVWSSEESITVEAVKKSSAKLFPIGSIGIAMYGATIGKLSIWGIEASTNQACAVAQAIPQYIYNEFLYYFLLSERKNLVNAGKGGAQPNISQGILKNWELKLPPIKEQKRIVAKIEELFSELDKSLESLQKVKELLKVYRQALLQSAFEGKLTEKWREKNQKKLESVSQLLARIKLERNVFYQQQIGKIGKLNHFKELKTNSNDQLLKLSVLPYGWCHVLVADLCEVVRGGSPRPAGDPKYYNGNIPFLKVADLTRSKDVYLKSYSYTIKEAGLKKTRSIHPNTLLLSNSGATLGVPKICLINATFNDGVAAFLGLSKDVLLYHYYFWSCKTRELRSINQGAAQPNLNTKIIEEMFIPICSKEEMHLIASVIEKKLSICDQLDSEIEMYIQKNKMLRQSILNKAFSGGLVPQDLTDEPAHVLLERIKVDQAIKKNQPSISQKRQKVSV